MIRFGPNAFGFMLAATLLIPSISVFAQMTINPPSSATDDPLYAPLTDSVEEDYLRSTRDLTLYEIQAEMTGATADAPAKITGSAQITYLNHTEEALDQLYLRLYPNVAEYAEGSLIVSDIEVDGDEASGELTENDTLLTTELVSPLPIGETIQIELGFVTSIPTNPSQSYGMFKYDSVYNTYSLAHWFPMLAGWDIENGWTIGPVSINGDPVFTEAAVFDVALEAPADLIFVTSGSEVEGEQLGRQQKHFASGPSRDFVMAASEDFVISELTVDETTVRSYALTGSEEASFQVLTSGAQAIQTYSELIGAYPYEEMDLVEVNIGNGAGGVEFPGMVFIGADYYDGMGSEVDIPSLLEFIVVHEVGHQWFYGVVGNNQYQHAFLDEALVNYLSVVYFAEVYGAEKANEQANLQLRHGYFNTLFTTGDLIVDQPTDDFDTMGAYGVFVYGKGALGFMELRREIGTDAFFDGLASYYTDFAFRVAQPSDLLSAFEESSGEDLSEFWDHWFHQAAGKEDFDAADLARVLREINE